MPQDVTTFKNSGTGKIIFILGIIVSVFWLLGQVINVFHFILVEAIFEMLWLPALGMLFLLPILSLVFWVKEKFSLRSLYLYTILFTVTTILIVLV
jgi:hypothetical protein